MSAVLHCRIRLTGGRSPEETSLQVTGFRPGKSAAYQAKRIRLDSAGLSA